MLDIDVTGRIVVGVDGTGGSEDTLRWAVKAAERHGRGLILAMAYPTVNLPNQWRSIKTGRMTGAMKRQQRKAEAALSKLVESVKEMAPTVDVNSVVHGTDPTALLVDLSATADLVVVGSYSLEGARAVTLSGVTDSVLVHARSSVAIVPKGTDFDRPGRVVVGVDESTDTEMTLKWALYEADTAGVELEMLTTWELPSSWGETGSSGLAAEEQTEIETALMDMLTKYLDEVGGLFPKVKVIKRVECDSALSALQKASKTARLIIIGSRSTGGLGSLLIGSISRLLARQSEAPVIAVRNRSFLDSQEDHLDNQENIAQ